MILPSTIHDARVAEHVDWMIKQAGSVKIAFLDLGLSPFLPSGRCRCRRHLVAHISKLYRSLKMEEGVPEVTRITCKWAFDAYNDLARQIGLPRARAFTDKRYKHLRARLQECIAADEDPKEIWELALKYLEESQFCRGNNERGWKADLDFILQPTSFWRLVEGRYSDGNHKTKPAKNKDALEILRERYPGQY